MGRTFTEADQQDFFAQPHIGVLSVASDNGRPPHTVPVWYDYQPGGSITFFTGSQGRKARKTRLLEAAGALTMCVQRPQLPYKYVTAECTITDINRKPDIEAVVAITGRYLPSDAAHAFAEAETTNPAGTFALFTARPVRMAGFDFAEE